MDVILETLIEALFEGLFWGLLFGAIPVIYGGMKGRIGLGITGFFLCAISGVIFGLLLAIPVAGIFVYYISQKDVKIVRATHKKCPHCAEDILIEANICKFCGCTVNNVAADITQN